MNLSQIRSRVLDFLREQAGAPLGIENAEVDRYINDGYRDLARRTKAVVEEFDLVIPAETPFATLPSNSLAPLTFVDKTSGYPIYPVHWTWIDKRDKIWVRKTRSRPSLVAAFGTYELMIYPSYSAEGTITINHVAVPADLTLDTEEPDLPEQHHMALVWYTNHRILLKDAQEGPQLGRALRQKKYYEETVDGLEVWGVSRQDTLRTGVYGNNLPHPSTIKEFG